MAAAGAAAFATHAARADDRPIPTAAAGTRVNPDEPVRIGVIGPGGMGTAHCRAITNLHKAGRVNAQIVAVCDVNDKHAARAQQVCQEAQGNEVTTYRYHEDLLKRDDIHGVLVASPEHWHAGHVEAAVAAGKDVYCEKPMTLRLNEAMRVLRLAEHNTDRIIQVGTQMIMLPKYQSARKLLEEGAIGKATFSQTSYCRNSLDGEWLYYGIDPEWQPGVNLDWDRWCGHLGPQAWDAEQYARWRRYRKWSTGIIGDLLVHKMTPMVYALQPGWPTRVVASGGHYVDKAMENHDQININVEFESEHTMIVAGSTANEVGLEDIIRGHEANIYLGGRHCVLRPERHFVDDIDEQTIESDDIGNDQDALRVNWIECIRTREPNQSPVSLAAQVMVIVDLATRSMWDGHAYTFDPKTRTATRV
jgi:predicted dehydrogenase